MALTPDQIVAYEFKQAMRGYAVTEVDDLLDRVADQLERNERDLADLQTRLDTAERRLAAALESESAVTRTLVTAQQTAERTVAEAGAHAAEVVAEAEQRAAELLASAQAQADEFRHAVSEETEQLRSEAQATAARELADAREQAAQLVEVARQQAEQERRDDEARRVQLHDELARLDDQLTRFRHDVRTLVAGHLAALDRPASAPEVPSTAVPDAPPTATSRAAPPPPPPPDPASGFPDVRVHDLG